MVRPLWRATADPRPLARGNAGPLWRRGGRAVRQLDPHAHALPGGRRLGAGVQLQPAAGPLGGLVQQPADAPLHVPLRLSYRLPGAERDASPLPSHLVPALAGAGGSHPGAPLPARQPAAGGAERRRRRLAHPAAVTTGQADPPPLGCQHAVLVSGGVPCHRLPLPPHSL